MNKEEFIELEKKITHNEKIIEKNATKIDKIFEKLETNTSRIQANSIALDILKDYKKERDRAYIVIFILLAVVIMLSSIVIYHHWLT